MFRFFEQLVQPHPDAEPGQPPDKLIPFVWHCTEGMRPHIAVMTLATALIGVFEAALFGFLGKVVDWLAQATPATLFSQHGGSLALLGAVLAASLVLVALQTMIKHQSLAGNFPMRL